MMPGIRRLRPLLPLRPAGLASGSAGALLLALCAGCGGDSPTSPAGRGPVLDPVSPPAVQEETVDTVEVRATDPDGDPLVLSARNLPRFAVLTDHGDGTAALRLAPGFGDAGSYPGVVIRASDGTRTDSVAVTLTVVPAAAATGFFYEPPSFCLAGAESDTLFLYNFGDAPVYWRPEHVPGGLQGLGGARTLSPRSLTEVVWTWDPGAPYPVVDSLVATTNDAGRSRVAVGFRDEGPSPPTDIRPPDAPIPAYPADGARFRVGDTIQVAWSRLDDCSGIAWYRLEISPTPDFSTVICCPGRLYSAAAELDVEPGDVGTAWWRVYAVDGAGLRGPAGPARSWTVAP